MTLINMWGLVNGYEGDRWHSSSSHTLKNQKKSRLKYQNNSGKALIVECQNIKSEIKHDKSVSLRLTNTCECFVIASLS
jgi:hypothetical protein